jgi:hypothetical protein
VYAVTFIWGRLLSTRETPPESTDRSGSLCVSGAEGFIKPICQIEFEGGEDSVFHAGDTSCAGWVSTTTGDFDSLGFLVRVRETNASGTGSPFLTFKTTPFSVELPIAKPSCFMEYIHVGDAESVAVTTRRVKGNTCPRGFMKGEWVPDEDSGERGYINGVWYDLFGLPVGSMAGSFGTDGGTRRFKGWLSGVYLTVVVAELEGTWSYDDPRLCVTCGEGRGRFAGKVRYSNCDKTGVMLGEFGDSASLPGSDPGKRALPLKGTWRASCASDEDCP